MAWVNRLRGFLGSNHGECKVCVVGIANSGKSTLMIQLKPPDVPMVQLTPMLPLSPFKAEKFPSKALTFVAFDLGEQAGFGNPWEDYYRDCHAIIFVVDSSDRYGLLVVEEEIQKMLNNPVVRGRRGIPLLVLANKMDEPGAVPSLQLATMLHLQGISRPWHVASSDVLTGEGLNEAFDWLSHQLRKVFKRPYTIPM